MDLERELRLAMAERVDGASAPEALVTAVRHRHHRRVVRRRVAVAAIAAGVAVAVVAPGYQSVRSTPTGVDRTLPAHPQVSPSPARVQPSVPRATQTVPSPGGVVGAPPSAPTGASPGGRQTQPSSHSGLPPNLSWVTYLPAGLKSAGPCLLERAGGRQNTTCQWTGGADWFKVDVIRGPALARVEELGPPSVTARHTTVHGHPALNTESPDGSARIVWIERSGVGVIVVVSRSLKGQLARIAGGIRP
ncbi:MAG: hypothetical protein JWN52_1254 [Actinomycetia bacterium]|nr:hypothetical protein [Actinomycetes bacterium]